MRSHVFAEIDPIVFWQTDIREENGSAAVRRENIREAFAIVVLDSYYGLIAADLAPWLRVNEEVGYPWVVDRDTLESIFSVMSSFEQLSRFCDGGRPYMVLR